MSQFNQFEIRKFIILHLNRKRFSFSFEKLVSQQKLLLLNFPILSNLFLLYNKLKHLYSYPVSHVRNSFCTCLDDVTSINFYKISFSFRSFLDKIAQQFPWLIVHSQHYSFFLVTSPFFFFFRSTLKLRRHLLNAQEIRKLV